MEEEKSTSRNAWSELKKYGLLQLDYVRLICIEKLSILLSMMALFGIVAALAVVALFYLGASLQVVLAGLVGGAWSYVLIAGFFLVIVCIVILFRKALIFYPITRFVSRLLIDKK